MNAPVRSYSPTSLTVFQRNCPHALDLYFQKRMEHEYEVEGPEAAEIGIVFHACLHAAGLASAKREDLLAAVNETAAAYASRISPDRAFQGRELAREFVEWWQFPVGYQFEHGLAFDPKWNPVDWDSPQRRLRMILDAIGTEEIEHQYYGPLRYVVGQDYKTGWGASPHELDSVQMDGYATALRKLYGEEVDAIRLMIVAVRYRKVYIRDYILQDEEDSAALDRRAERLVFAIRAAHKSDGHARIGLGCMRCNFTEECETFRARAAELREHPLDLHAPPESLARDYAVLKSRTKELDEHLRVATNVKPIELDGQVLGWHPKEKTELKDPGALIAVWEQAHGAKLTEDGKGHVRAMLLAADPGSTHLQNVIKKCSKKLGYKNQKLALEEVLPKHTDIKDTMEFGFRAAEPAPKEGKKS